MNKPLYSPGKQRVHPLVPGIFHRLILLLTILLVTQLFMAVYAQPDPEYQYWADQNYPPFEFMDKDGNAAGFSVDLIQAIANEMQLSVNASAHPWSEVKQALTDNQIHLSGTMAYDLNRTENFVYSVPIITLNWYIYSRDDEQYSSLDDLKGKRIVLAKGDIYEEKLGDGKFQAEIGVVPDYRDQLRLLSSGKYDAAIINRLTASYLMEDMGITNIRPTGEPLERLQLCVAAHISNPGLISQVNEGLVILNRNGIYSALSEKWFAPHEREIISGVYKDILLYVLLPFLIILLIILVWIWSLRRMVTAKTQALHIELDRRRTAEKALRESEEKYRTLFTSMVEGVAIYEIISDSEGKPIDYRILNVNPAYEVQTGMPPDQVTGKSAREIYGEEIPPFLDVYGRVDTTGDPVTFTTSYAPTGKTYSITAVSLDKGIFASFFQDVTSIKNLEIERERALNQIEKNIEEFMILNDQIRNPLTVILIKAEVAGPEFYDEISKHVHEIDAQINRLDNRALESEKVMNYLKKHLFNR